jgi:hypothetical protein
MFHRDSEYLRVQLVLICQLKPQKCFEFASVHYRTWFVHCFVHSGIYLTPLDFLIFSLANRLMMSSKLLMQRTCTGLILTIVWCGISQLVLMMDCDNHRWPIVHLAPLLLGPEGSMVRLGVEVIPSADSLLKTLATFRNLIMSSAEIGSEHPPTHSKTPPLFSTS